MFFELVDATYRPLRSYRKVAGELFGSGGCLSAESGQIVPTGFSAACSAPSRQGWQGFGAIVQTCWHQVSAAAGLLQRCWTHVHCEPIQLTRDDDGVFHWAASPPLKTVVDMHNIPFGGWFKRSRNYFTIELDGREVIYERVAVTPEGNWICTLKVS